MKSFLSYLFVFLSCYFFSQTKVSNNIIRKNTTAVKTEVAPKLDGILDDEVWKNVPIATNFFERQPNNGKPQAAEFRTEVKILYDNTGIYFGIQMYDPNPEKISKELTERDNIANDDFVGVIINGYNDKQQSNEFIVTAAGVQSDGKVTLEDEDFSWNGVWYSATKINEKGWIVEMKIPYSELRFPKKEIQEWGFNIFRRIQRDKTSFDWNLVDNKKGGYLLYDGMLKGIENIETATRLSFLPYFSSYINNYDGKTTANVNGGMDVKYGINDAFTLDLTLIPDFGQTSFDQSVLNLGPFEQQFNEQRSFFTEGTELFNKGGLFYSRRIGGNPSYYPTTNDDEEIIENPSKVKLFNAVKVSGRTNKGLGIGFFNAITEKTEAIIKNNITQETRKEVTEPVANYNVLVLDQRFRENSSVSLVNTNVTRNGSFRDANVTALLFDIKNKKNTYQYYGSTKGSTVNDEEKTFGNESTLGFNKIEGANRFGGFYRIRTKNYDIGDLGYNDGTNFHKINLEYSYQLLQPNKHFNNINFNSNINTVRRLETDLFTKLVFNNNISLTNKKFQNFGVGIEFTPNGENDIYEPRTFGKFLYIPGYFDSWFWFNSDSRKKLTYNISVDYYAYDQKGRNFINNEVGFRYRFSDKLYFNLDTGVVFSNKETGFVGKDAEGIYIGKRNRYTVTNSISSQYTFNEKMAISLAFRHYYTEVTYKDFYALQDNGRLSTTNYNENNNETYNSWNVDLRYSWWFAPGSQLTLLYRNSIEDYLDISKMNFKQNFKSLFNEPQINNLSLKLTYFIDYNRAKNWVKKS